MGGKNEIKKDAIAKIEKIKESVIPTAESISIFFRKNNYLIVILLTAMMLITMCDNRSRNEQMEKVLKENVEYLKQNIRTTGFVTATGMLLTVDRKPINYNDDRIKAAIVNLSLDPFLQGADDIRAGKVYGTTKEMIDKNQKFNFFFNNLIKNERDFHELFGAIYKTVSSLYYPEHITVIQQNIVNFSARKDIEDNNIIDFSATVVYKLKTRSWIVQLNKWVEQDVTVTAALDGEIIPELYANSGNLLGFKLKKLTMPLIQKPDIADLRR